MKKRKGAILVIGFVFLVCITLCLGILVFDLGGALSVHSDLANIANAAAVAGVRKGFSEEVFMQTGKRVLDPGKAREGVEQSLRDNARNASWNVKLTKFEIQSDKSLLNIEVEATVPMTFMKAVSNGLKETKVKAKGTAAIKQKRI